MESSRESNELVPSNDKTSKARRDQIAKAAMSMSIEHSPSATDIVSIIILVVGCLWSLLYVIQSLMAYGTAYRKAKSSGDSGVSLFGWLIVYNLAALVPFLGMYLWSKSKKQA